MTESWHTHHLEIADAHAVKTFREATRDEPGREWRALTLLHRHAPGLAPEPLSRTTDPAQPSVTMTRIGGTPLRGARLDPRQLAALAAATTRLHTALPPQVAAELPPRLGAPGVLFQQIRELLPTPADAAADAVYDPAVAEGCAAVTRWLDTPEAETFRTAEPEPILGHADGNPANYLWDGRQVRILDFENSGRSDRALELAEITEHVGSWAHGELFDPAEFLSHFTLDPAESARLLTARRALAGWWLALLSHDDPEDPRNPPGTTSRQAKRVLDLLGH
jgi:hypothetical protein